MPRPIGGVNIRLPPKKVGTVFWTRRSGNKHEPPRDINGGGVGVGSKATNGDKKINGGGVGEAA
ncbi:hypothetical protein MNBD_ALPHA11-1535, partial [hydrothermal vent metagenome]